MRAENPRRRSASHLKKEVIQVKQNKERQKRFIVKKGSYRNKYQSVGETITLSLFAWGNFGFRPFS